MKEHKRLTLNGGYIHGQLISFIRSYCKIFKPGFSLQLYSLTSVKESMQLIVL
jgi:hypothetical protein